MVAMCDHHGLFAVPQTAGAGHPAGLPSRPALACLLPLMVWARSRFALAARRGGSGRWAMLAAAAAMLLLGGPAAAQEELRGTWRGAYHCNQGNTALALTIEPRKDGSLTALFHFEAATDNPGVPTGCFEMEGRSEPAIGRVTLRPLRWILRPANYLMVGLDGLLSADRLRIEGVVSGPGCTAFEIERAPGPSAAEACRSGAPLLSLR